MLATSTATRSTSAARLLFQGTRGSTTAPLAATLEYCTEYQTGDGKEQRSRIVHNRLIWNRNTNGTTAFQGRVHSFDISFTPTTNYPSGNNLQLTYKDTLLLTDPKGNPVSGLDSTTTLNFTGFPAIPAGAFTGDGFGGSGPGGVLVSIDMEGLVIDGSKGYWISDEYGPYIYHFNTKGQMDQAIRPPNAFIPRRNGTDSFNSDTPPIFAPNQIPNPEDPDSGRSNNQGFEGLTYSTDGNALFALLQSATVQDGGTHATRRYYTRLIKYALQPSGGLPIPRQPVAVGEWVVKLPTFNDPTEAKNPRVAAQSEIHSIDDTTFLILARDSNHGRGQDDTTSIYRHADVFSIANATNILGKYDGYTDAVAPDGNNLRSNITTATYCPFLDYNVNSQLANFNLCNGCPNSNPGLLNEKWESLALVPVDGSSSEYYLISASDNDFITQDGYIDFGKVPYKDESGFNLDNQVLVFKVNIPGKVSGDIA